MNDTISYEPIDLNALRRKDKTAFAQLVDQFSDQIYRLGFRMLGNQQDAEDILQETFIKAFEKIEGFKGQSKISTWLYRIAVNEALMLIRKRKGITLSISADDEAGQEDLLPRQIIDWCCLPEKELLSAETRHHIREAIENLSTANRAVFILRDVEGLSTREAAEILEISESAVKVRLMRARMQLREDLTGYFTPRIPKELL